MNRLLGKRAAMTLSLLVPFLLAGCGGGGGGSNPNAGTYTCNATTTVAGEMTGCFVDAPTKGLAYSSSPSGLSGITDANGNYHYQAGDKVTFSIPNAGGAPIQLGSVTPPSIAPLGSDNPLTMVINMVNGQQIAQALQALNHSTDTSMLDVSGLSLDNSNASALNNYISSGGLVLPNGADHTIASNITSMLAAVQGAATFSPSARLTTTVDSTFLDKVIAHIGSTITGLKPRPSAAASSQTSNSEVFVFYSIYSGTQWNHTIKYGKDGAFHAVTTQAPAGCVPIYYPTYTYQIISSTTIIDSFSGQSGCPNVSTTITSLYTDQYNNYATYYVNGGDGTLVPFSMVYLDTTFDQTAIAGKTLQLSTTAWGTCPRGPETIIVSPDGTSATGMCTGTATTVDTWTIAPLSNEPGTLTWTGSDGKVTYMALAKGTTVNDGTVVMVRPGTVSAPNSGFGLLSAVTATP